MTLHHGDNLDVMQRLLAEGARVHLAYLDPPFNTGRDFAYQPPGGGPEEHAYSDRWPSLEAFLDALRERVAAVRDLLTPDGCMFLHVDPATSHYVKVMLDGVFGRACFANEIVWRYRKWSQCGRHFNRSHDTLFRYLRKADAEPRWTQLYEERAPSTQAVWGPNRVHKTTDPATGKTRTVSLAQPSEGAPMSDVWEIGIIAPIGLERTGYPTQKPEPLLERIITACSHEGDTVLDPYAGSCTSGAVAERLGRNWIGIDASPVAIRVGGARLHDARFGVKAREAAGPQLTLGARPISGSIETSHQKTGGGSTP